MIEPTEALKNALTTLRENADRVDDSPTWPASSWQAMQETGVLKWCIPVEEGGSGLDPIALLEGYEQLASACLTTCFILSQRDAACRRLREYASGGRPRQLLSQSARGEALATVGISQLTTSRQHGGPALIARPSKQGYHLTGVAPWVTGAERADYLILGATLEDGRQLLGVVPRQDEGLTIGAPLDLMALRGSLTALVSCREVVLANEWILAGPVEKVLQTGKGGAGGLETSCLALGVARAAIDLLLEEAKNRPMLAEMCDRLSKAYKRLRSEMHGMAGTQFAPEAATDLRAKANTLVLRSTQSALTMCKGAGFVHPHPAQRLARQALFFLVWSCPQVAATATLEAMGGNDASLCY